MNLPFIRVRSRRQKAAEALKAFVIAGDGSLTEQIKACDEIINLCDGGVDRELFVWASQEWLRLYVYFDGDIKLVDLVHTA